MRNAAQRLALAGVHFARATLILAVMSWLAPAPAAAEPRTATSMSGHFRLGYESRPGPIVINRMHDWVLSLESADGTPVEGATFAISGRMPAHDHGLPTAPRVTRELGNGEYLLQGLRFHMHGDWEITISVTAGDRRDTVILSFGV